jgi:hypothetical protein
LQADIANMMERADELAEHPLAARQPSFTVIMTRDPESTLVTALNINWNNIDKSTWVYCAVLMRPMVFLAGDDIALGPLLDRIGAEHPLLGRLRRAARGSSRLGRRTCTWVSRTSARFPPNTGGCRQGQ